MGRDFEDSVGGPVTTQEAKSERRSWTGSLLEETLRGRLPFITILKTINLMMRRS